MPTPEKLSLIERMAQARERTAAARAERGLPPALPVPPARAAAPRPAAAAAPAAPVTGPRASAPPPAHRAPAPAPAAGGAHGDWQVVAKPGQHIVLMPGQMHISAQARSLRTLLGSCVAITLWHPHKLIGGMCHFLLPSRARRHDEAPDGRYGEEAIDEMVRFIRNSRTDPRDYVAHLYGGADTMPEGTNVKFAVGERNIEMGWSLIEKFGFQLQGVDVGEDVPRTVTLNVGTGEVDMQRVGGKLLMPGTPTPSARLRT